MENAKAQICFNIFMGSIQSSAEREGVIALGGNQLLINNLLGTWERNQRAALQRLFKLLLKNTQFGVLGFFSFSLRHSTILIFVTAYLCEKGYFYLA